MPKQLVEVEVEEPRFTVRIQRETPEKLVLFVRDGEFPDRYGTFTAVDGRIELVDGRSPSPDDPKGLYRLQKQAIKDWLATR